MDIFGTYTINSGTYKLTIQNIIKKVFNFADGGTIVFGGNPMNAASPQRRLPHRFSQSVGSSDRT